MMSNSRCLLLACLTAPLPPQQGASPQPDPLVLVAQAQKLSAAGEIEDAILLAWQALAVLDPLDPDPERRAAAATILSLLGECDPNHEARLEVNAAVAKAQVTIATMYRRKKWLGTAAAILATAESFDRKMSRAERIAFDKQAHKPSATPASTARPDATRLNELFDRDNTAYVDGSWRLVDDAFLESKAHDGRDVFCSWLAKTTHEDGEIVLEIQATEPHRDRNAGILFGAVDRRNYYCARFGAFLGDRFDLVEIFQVQKGVAVSLGEVNLRNRGQAASSHRLVLHVRGTHLRFQVDDRPPVEADTDVPVRGQLGLCVGVTGYESCPVQFRRFDIGPLPGDQATAEDRQALQETRLRTEIAAALDAARGEIQSKAYEPAAARLRLACYRLRALPAEPARTELEQSIAVLLKKSDRQHSKRAQADSQCADALVALADKYAAAGMPRAAFELVAAAASFAPLALAERESQAQQAVDAWHAARAGSATSSTAELQPSAEGGAALRAWFTEGRRLHERSTIDWVLGEMTARVDNVRSGQISVLMPRRDMPSLSQATIAVRLPSVGAAAGFCFDVAGSHDFGIARLERGPTGLVLSALRWRDNRWTPLASEAIDMPESKRGGWFAIAIALTDKGLVARSGGKSLTVDRKDLGDNAGRYGLVVTNSGEPATIEVAEFRFTK